MNLNINPSFMDIFGFVGFVFIIFFAINLLKRNKIPEKWLTIVLLIIGVLGLIVDGVIVYINFLR